MNYKIFKKNLTNLGVKSDDIIMLHTDLSNFKKGSWSDKCSLFSQYLKRFFEKKGTILVPAFTYSFCKNRNFDLHNSPSEVGIFDEYFRKQNSIVRSQHPIFSFSCYGKMEEVFTQNNSNSATGNGSIFEKFFAMNGKILFFGARFITSCTFLHFVEQSNRVPYRYSKIFKGNLKIKKKIIKNQEFEFFVRSTERYNFIDYKENTKIESDLKKKKILKMTNINKLSLSICGSQELFYFVTNKLNNNLYYILDNKPTQI